MKYAVIGKGSSEEDFEYLGTTASLETARTAIMDFFCGFDEEDPPSWSEKAGIWTLSAPWADEQDQAIIGFATPEYDLDKKGVS